MNVLEGKLVLSERAAMMEAVAAALNPGDMVEGVVTRLADYGAFVSLRSPDGNLHGVEARVMMSPQCWLFLRQWLPVSCVSLGCLGSRVTLGVGC